MAKKVASKAAKSISLKELSVAVEKAIRVDKDRLVPGTISQIHPGVIFGRQLNSNITLEEANEVAERITKSVSSAAKAAGLNELTPAVLINNKLITVGFIGPTQVFSANE